MSLRAFALIAGLLLHTPTPCGAALWPDVTELNQEITAVTDALAALPPTPIVTPPLRRGYHSRFTATDRAVGWVQIDLGQTRDFDLVCIVPVSSNGSEAYGMPPRYRVDASDQPDFSAYHTLLDRSEADEAATTSAPIAISCPGTRARYIRFTATRLAQQSLSRGFYCLGELFVFQGERNLGAGSAVTYSGSLETQPTWADQNLTDSITSLGAPVILDRGNSNGWHSGIELTQDVHKWVQLDLGDAQPLDELRLIPAHPPDFPDRQGFGFPLRFRVEVSNTQDFQQSQIVFDATRGDHLNPGDNPVVIPLLGVRARYVRITATRLWLRSGDYVFALAEAEVLSLGKNVALDVPVTSLDETRTLSWAAGNLVDGRTSLGYLVSWPGWLRDQAQRARLHARLADLQTQRTSATAVRQKTGFYFATASGFSVVFGLGALSMWQRLRQRQMLATLRQQIARDLHDEIGSSLGSIALMSELAMRDGDASSLEEIHRLAGEAAASMRGIIWLVRESGTPTLERLIDTMRQTAETLLGGIAWKLDLPTEKAPQVSSLEIHRHLFLFYKETLHNIARHAKATRVRIAVSWTASTLILCVEDDGVGFDTNMAASGHGSGLENLRHRAAALAGSVFIHSVPYEGTCITLQVPLLA